MKQFLVSGLILVMVAFASVSLAGEASEAQNAHPLKAGEHCPPLLLPAAQQQDVAAYLGVGGDEAFSIASIQARVIILQVFSMYCPHCQKEAPLMNELYGLIRQKGLQDDVKIIGVGAGNSEIEVDVFRKKFSVPFPLFPDADFTIHKALGEVGTPFFYVLKKSPEGGYDIVISSLGRMESVSSFLDNVIKSTDLH